MLTPTWELISDLTIDLTLDNEEHYIKCNGLVSCGSVSVQILDVGAQCTIKSTLASNEFTNLKSTTFSDCIWENIKVGGIEFPVVTTDVASTTFYQAPSLFHIQNVSGSNLRVRISFRGNR